MPRIKNVGLALFGVIVSLGAAEATTYVTLRLHERVQLSDTIVVVRVVDGIRGLMTVERVLKGAPPKQITLVSFIDRFAHPSEHKYPRVADRELVFLKKEGDAYAPLGTQYGRLAVQGDLVIESRAEPRSLSDTLASIERLVAFQARAARSDVEAEAAYVAALENADSEVVRWALDTAARRIKLPSPALARAVLARWPKDVSVPADKWVNDAGAVANAVVSWRLSQAAPFFARILTTSPNGDERAWAAKALGGTGDREYLAVVRRVASADPHARARAFAYDGIVSMIGPDSFGDLRAGAKDVDEEVRAHAVHQAYHILEFDYPEPRWPPPSRALIAEVRTFLRKMQRDPARPVSTAARSMLANLARHRR